MYISTEAPPFLTNPKQITAWLKSMGIESWKIHVDGLVAVEGAVNLNGKLSSLTRLPVRFW